MFPLLTFSCSQRASSTSMQPNSDVAHVKRSAVHPPNACTDVSTAVQPAKAATSDTRAQRPVSNVRPLTMRMPASRTTAPSGPMVTRSLR